LQSPSVHEEGHERGGGCGYHWRVVNVTTEQIFDEILRRTRGGERLILCTVVRTRGSCPQSAGAKMLVLADGKTLGTLGGGCVEAEVRRRALEMLQADESGLLEFTLDHDYGWDDGLICGGIMDIAVQTLDAPRAAGFATLLEDIRAGRPATLRVPFVRGGEQQEYTEPLDPAPTLLIAGAGHVGQALAALAQPLGFLVSVIDDRPDYACAERFPNAKQLILGDIEAELRKFPIDEHTYAVIVTRGHQRDGQALAAVIRSPARYVGLIGSKRKIKAIFDDLAQQGVPFETLSRVHAPIGYEIGAVTVPEIAISIAAELIAVRRGFENKLAKPMKIDEEQLRSWLSRPERSGGPH
jgi:xanthine dehydrogenase accessory factor